jgi:hypothetical protein
MDSRSHSCDTLVNYERLDIEQQIVRRDKLNLDSMSVAFGAILASSMTLLLIGLLEIVVMTHNWTSDGRGLKQPIEIYNSTRLLYIGYLTISCMMMFTCLPLVCCHMIISSRGD